MTLDPLWLHSPANCRVCSYEWQAVYDSETETTNLECPRCGALSGELKEDA